MFDYFPRADGRSIHPYEIINVLNELAPWIVAYRVLQEQKDLVRLYFVSRDGPSADQFAEMCNAIGKLLGPQVAFEERQIDRLRRWRFAKPEMQNRGDRNHVTQRVRRR